MMEGDGSKSILTIDEVHQEPRARWDAMTAGEAANQPDEHRVIDERRDAWEAPDADDAGGCAPVTGRARWPGGVSLATASCRWSYACSWRPNMPEEERALPHPR